MHSTIGTRYNDFRYTKILPIDELQLTLYELVHEPTGAIVIHLDCDDTENVFCLSLQTLPYNSNGVAHILEHTTLCGSKKYPVKDPFFSMNRRSLNTFMNAFTGPDFTCYPAASQVEQDFYNLLDVYLDAVFHPILDERSFLQEGHRLAFEKPDDPASPLVYKGIVYNEMKGSLANADMRFWHAITEHLVPDLPYSYNSGGDPKEIPTLTYAQLKEFHSKYYHPSHAIFYFYGNLPLEKHLDFIQKRVLDGAEKKPPLPPLTKQVRFTEPVTRAITYPASGENLSGKTYFSLSWLTAPITDQQDALALSVLDSVLMDTDASPLKAAILASGLCTHADSHLDLEMSEIPYMIICRGSEANHAKRLEKLILDELTRIAKEGFPPHLVDSAIHHLEFMRTEITGGSYPFGLSLFLRAVLSMQHGCEPENALLIHSLFEKLLVLIKEPRYFNRLIEKHFLNNPHRLSLVMTPDTEQAAREVEEERKALDAIEQGLSDEQKKGILRTTRELKAFQDLEQPLDCLPKIALSDVPREIPTFPLNTIGSISSHTCFTNHIAYADVIFDLPTLSSQELPYAKLLTTMLFELGSGKRDYKAALEYMHAHTGGVEASIALHPHVDPQKGAAPTFTVRGKALDRNIDHLFAIITDTLTAPRLDEAKRIKELVLQLDTALQNRLTSNPLRYAISLASSDLSEEACTSYLMSGLPYVAFIRDLAKHIDKKLPALLESFAALAPKLLHCNSPQLILSCDTAELEAIRGKNPLEALLAKPYTPWSRNIPIEKMHTQVRLIDSPVAFTAHALRTVPLTHPDAAAISIGTYLMENLTLHARIREQGGAYGSGASYDYCAGIFYFYAYRDPHITSSLAAFKESIEMLAQGDFSDDDLEEAKLGLVQSLDHPVSPGARAMTTFSLLREGKTDEVRRAFRTRVFDVTAADIRKAAESHLNYESGKTAVFVDKALPKKEGLDLPMAPA